VEVHGNGHVYGTVVVDGFRRSLDETAAFRFSRPSSSYSARMGTPENVGVIGVAFFSEQELLVPRREPSGELVWRKPSAGNVGLILLNPAHAGAFVYGRTRSVLKAGASGRRVQQRPGQLAGAPRGVQGSAVGGLADEGVGIDRAAAALAEVPDRSHVVGAVDHLQLAL